MNLYETLGLSVAADAVVIKAAYRALSQRYHPDKCPPTERDSAHRRMAEINTAFQVLGDPASKSRYDDQLAQDSAPARQAGETAGAATTLRQGIGHQGARTAILFVTTVIAFACGVDVKPWWQWTWELLAAGFDPPVRYVLHWPLIAVTLSVGVWLASRVGRLPR